MAEKLTKTAIKSELTRRIDWLEVKHGFKTSHNDIGAMDDNPSMLINYGRYLELPDMRWQVGAGEFTQGLVK